MKKIINDPKNYVDEAMEGIQSAYSDKIDFFENDKRKNAKKIKSLGLFFRGIIKKKGR